MPTSQIDRGHSRLLAIETPTALGHTSTRMVEQHYGHLAPSYVRRTLRENLPRFTNARPKVRRLKKGAR